MKSLLRYLLQPVTVVCVVTVWLTDPGSPAMYPLIVLGVQLVLGTLEYVIPARPDFRFDPLEKLGQVVVTTALVFLAVFIGELYATFVSAPLEGVRGRLGLTFWPRTWPVLAQMAIVFFASELVWYWIHRAEHRWASVWRATGHGAHHSFKRLNAINFGLNHPFELLPLVAPAITIDLLFGVGAPAAGAGLLLGVQASFAHSNLDLNSRVIGWFFTTNRHHLHHHSAVMEQSNNNYGCAVILFDRIFGTFADQPTSELGTGPTEPSLWRKALMPFIEPGDTAIAPSSANDLPRQR